MFDTITEGVVSVFHTSHPSIVMSSTKVLHGHVVRQDVTYLSPDPFCDHTVSFSSSFCLCDCSSSFSLVMTRVTSCQHHPYVMQHVDIMSIPCRPSTKRWNCEKVVFNIITTSCTQHANIIWTTCQHHVKFLWTPTPHCWHPHPHIIPTSFRRHPNDMSYIAYTTTCARHAMHLHHVHIMSFTS